MYASSGSSHRGRYSEVGPAVADSVVHSLVQDCKPGKSGQRQTAQLSLVQGRCRQQHVTKAPGLHLWSFPKVVPVCMRSPSFLRLSRAGGLVDCRDRSRGSAEVHAEAAPVQTKVRGSLNGRKPVLGPLFVAAVADVAVLAVLAVASAVRVELMGRSYGCQPLIEIQVRASQARKDCRCSRCECC
jgi:hypothetical protein